MKMRLFTCLIFALLLSNDIVSQAILIQKSENDETGINIPFEKYQFENGLTLIIHVDKSDPMVHVDVTYHVGSSREEPGKSGFAHFFEHMMFQGSRNVADDEHFKIINEAGGTMNGSTNFDRTNYFETVPSNQLEVALWLEADRMGFLLDSVNSPKFEIQRATVKNERGQNYDNKPYGRNRETINKALYPYGHPYSWPTIGWMDDIDRADLDDLRKFFLTYYGPNNAVLTVAGNVDVKNVITLVEKYFAGISRGPEVSKPIAPKFTIDSDKYISYTDNVRNPMLQITYPTVPIYHEDEIALDALAGIMGGSDKSSFLYQYFIKTQKALRVSAFHPTAELAGQFSFSITAMPNTSLAEINKEFELCLEEFAKKGVTQDEVNKFIKKNEAQLYNSLSSISGKASILAYYETFTGDANFIAKDQSRYSDLTAEKVMDVFNRYFVNKHSVRLSVVGQSNIGLIAAPDNIKMGSEKNSKGNAVLLSQDIIAEDMEAEVASISAPSEKLNALMTSRKNDPDKFDRSKKPNPGPAPIPKSPVIWTGIIGEKVKLYGIRNSENPIIAGQLRFKGGHRLSSLEISKAGIAEFTARMLQEGTKEYSAEEISEKLGALGSSVSVSSDLNEIRFTVQCLSSELAATNVILRSMIFDPAFDEKAFLRIKKQMLETIENQKTQAGVMADNAFYSNLYESGSIQAIPQSGTKESIEAISLSDIKSYYESWLNQNNASLIISGDLNMKDCRRDFDFLSTLPVANSNKAIEGKSKNISKTEIIFIDKPKAPQSEIRIGYPAIAYDAYEDFFKNGIMNYALGGSFSSRINLNLREDKGYTYGARSRFTGDAWQGVFLASAGVKASATDSSIIEFMKEIKAYATSGITQKELNFTINSFTQSEALKYETPAQVLNILRRMDDNNLEADYITKQQAILKNMTVSETNKLASKYLPYNKMIIVVVGDREIVFPGLKKLGYPIRELGS